MELSCDRIRELLPHRYPFLLVDKVLECEPGVRTKAVKCVSLNEMHFMGHFPDMSVMPGVLILEAMAQTCGIAMLTVPGNEGKLAVLGGIKNARFKKPVVPGDVICMECSITKARDNIIFGQGTAEADGNEVCSAEFSFAVIENTNVQT